MKKTLIFTALAALLAGCTKTAETPSPEPTPQETASVTQEPVTEPSADPEAEYEIMEGVLEEELPQSLTVTIQDMRVIFTKDLDYVCEEDLQVGDELILYYTGSFDDVRLTVIKAEKR